GQPGRGGAVLVVGVDVVAGDAQVAGAGRGLVAHDEDGGAVAGGLVAFDAEVAQAPHGDADAVADHAVVADHGAVRVAGAFLGVGGVGHEQPGVAVVPGHVVAEQAAHRAFLGDTPLAVLLG